MDEKNKRKRVKAYAENGWIKMNAVFKNSMADSMDIKSGVKLDVLKSLNCQTD
jgi:hypothetical protein